MFTLGFFRKCALVVAYVCASIGSQSSGQSKTDIGYFQEYALGAPSSGPAIVAVDENDNVWVAEAKTGKLVMFSNGAFKEFDIGTDSRPVGVAVGSQRNGQAGYIWVAASYDNKIVRFDVTSHEKREYKIDGDESWPFNLAIGRDGSIWFTERASGRVGRLDPGTGKILHYEPPTKHAGPAGLGISSLTGKIWFSESYADRIGTLDPSSGEIHEYKMGDKSTGLTTGPAGLCIDRKGQIWFAKLDGKLGHIVDGDDSIEVVEFPPSVRRPAGIVSAPNGDIWAAALDGNVLVRYRPTTREFVTFPIPTGEADFVPSVPPNAKSSRPFGIAVDGQGNVWFSEQYTGKLGVLDAAPPLLQIASPDSSTHSAFPLLSLRVSDRVSGVAKVTVRVDNKVVEPVQGRLDLHDFSPGDHRLEVTAVDRAGLQAQVANTFDYQPSPLALLQDLELLHPRAQPGEIRKADLIQAARSLLSGDMRSKLRQIRMDIVESEQLFEPFSKTSLLATTDYLMSHASRLVELQILDVAPFFSPPRVSITVGDTVSWKYAPPSDGHTISSELHRVEVVGKALSGVLRSGESFSYKFDDPGEFIVRDERNTLANALITVLPK